MTSLPNRADLESIAYRSTNDKIATLVTSAEEFGYRREDKSPLVSVPDKRGLRKLWAFVGPGFLVAIAYIDPGNFESDLQAGANFKFQLLWVLMCASIAGLIIQSLAANLGVVTGKHLAEHCRSEYPKPVNLGLWVVAELAIVASDIPEVIGMAFALNMLFSCPIWVGVLITGLSTLLLLTLQKYGVRKLESFVSILVFLIAVCFLVEVGYAKPDAGEVLKGLFVPSLGSRAAVGIAISLVGAVVMPHNLYLHSALVLSRDVPKTKSSIEDACRYNFMECGFALILAFVINVSVISVSGAICHSANLSAADGLKCEHLHLYETPLLLRNTLGAWSDKIFALALLASGQTSTVTGTFAGQYVMQGFLDLRMQPFARNLLTRSVAIVPSLVVVFIGGSHGAGRLIIASSIILSFELPFALLPLLKFTSSPVKMGPFVNHVAINVATWIVGFFVMSVNIYFLCSELVNFLRTAPWPHWVVMMCGVLGFLAIVCYFLCIVYLALRSDSTVTYSAPSLENPEAGIVGLPTTELEDVEEDFLYYGSDGRTITGASPRVLNSPAAISDKGEAHFHTGIPKAA
ncbi:hypothetical protein CBR_g3061 [Chara braunii]|uniref:Uncharacterized protein n=1 Tax=Chara braunii TaxID=69332 RepID=A0A388KET6_CHABU|nr:hypothetical protein CBR_g3061 [Chara braunii]|eukprot:GBG68517.1 hypothetical protein CBR_g3061 [Chara braunii]